MVGYRYYSTTCRCTHVIASNWTLAEATPHTHSEDHVEQNGDGRLKKNHQQSEQTGGKRHQVGKNAVIASKWTLAEATPHTHSEEDHVGQNGDGQLKLKTPSTK